MIKWHTKILVNGSWVRAVIRSESGNKYAAFNQYREEQAAKGLEIKGFDFTHAWYEYA